MKKNYRLLFALMLLSSVIIFGQAPQKIDFQGMARDGSGNPLLNQTIGVRISVIQGATTVYTERHTPQTDNYGLFMLHIGDGTPLSGDFSIINWGLGNHQIKVEVDPNGEWNYVNMGTSVLTSTPYALHANTADSIVGGITLPNGETIGDILVWNGSNWVPDNNQITVTNDNVIMNNSFSLSNGFFLAYFATNNLSFVNDHSYIQIFPNSTAPNRVVTLPNGETNGQMIVLTCHWNTASNGFRLNSTGNIKLNGGGLLDLYPNDIITLMWNGQSWNEISRSDN